MTARSAIPCLFLLLGTLRGSSAGAAAAWKPFGAHRIAAFAPILPHAPGFTPVRPEETGIAFTNFLSQARKMANANLMNGSGVALGDFDGDGLCDLYFCQLSGTNALYKNLGDWHFTNVTDQAGVACPKQTSTGAVFADINGDGKLDLLVTSMGGPHACFINLGNGRFTNTIATAGFSSRLGASSMALADIDGNGTLDLYIANYGATSILRSGGALNLSYENGKPVVRGRYAQRIKIINGTMWELGEPDALYLNDGKGHFIAVSWTDGTFQKADGTPLKEAEVPWDQGLSVMMRDLNGDGAPDIYVCNDDFTPDRFWINNGKGRFHELPQRHWRTTSHYSMGVDVADVDRDGKDDLFVVDMLGRERRYFMTQKGNMPAQPARAGDLDAQVQVRRNTLLRNRGALDFEEVAYYAGVAASDWSWSGLFLDVDLDGWEDLLVSNGFEQNADDMDTQDKVRGMGQNSVEQSRRAQLLYSQLRTPNRAFHNLHDLKFEEVGRQWGFDATDISQGMALADLDNDGDLDVVVSVYNGEALAYRNEASTPRLAVKLKGAPPNTEGIGAKITVEGGPVRQSQQMICGARYVSGDEAMRVFACRDATKPMSVQVEWRSGKKTRVKNIPANSLIEISEGETEPLAAEAKPAVTPLFIDVSHLLQARHQEVPFDDFNLQPSLPRKLSVAGPALVWNDLDGDSEDDLLIGGLGLYRKRNQGGFEKIGDPFQGETSGMLAWIDEKDEVELIVAADNYRKKSGHSMTVLARPANNPQAIADFPGNATGGTLCISEVGGEVYLFQGNRALPGAYPTGMDSFLFRRVQGKWTPQTEPVLSGAGIVNAALWSDLDGDGRPELIAACEWGAIRIYTMHAGHLAEVTHEWGMDGNTGLWQGLAAADLDRDGRMDLVAGNWGLNNFYALAPEPKVDIFFTASDSSSHIDMVEAYFDERLGKTVPWRDKRTLSQFWPWLNEKFPTHAQFAQAAMDEVFAGRPAPGRLTAKVLASSLFLNRGNHFDRTDLPREAQFAPVFGISVGDFDGDGTEDLFLAQNFSAVREFDSRLTAGRGLLLRGTTNGTFLPLTTAESGIQIFGDQRASATADFDRDGRLDLAVTQNGAETKLYRNTTANPGLRIRLRGKARNRLAAGTRWRVGDDRGWGPLHEIQVGSGYRSQDSPTKIVALPSGSARLQVQWPGEKPADYPVPPGAKEIEIRMGPGLKMVN